MTQEQDFPVTTCSNIQRSNARDPYNLDRHATTLSHILKSPPLESGAYQNGGLHSMSPLTQNNSK
jgi:hypothetical protein